MVYVVIFVISHTHKSTSTHLQLQDGGNIDKRDHVGVHPVQNADSNPKDGHQGSGKVDKAKGGSSGKPHKTIKFVRRPFNVTAPKHILGKAKRCKFPRHITIRLLPGPRHPVQINHLTHFTPPPCTSQPIIMLVINSKPENIELRKAIRRSWGNGKRFTEIYGAPYAWRVIFAIGSTGHDDGDAKLRAEHKQFQDLLLGDFVDTDRNMSRKTLMGIHWSYIYCQPLFLYKGNDNAFVNAPRMFEFLGWLIIRRKLNRLWYGQVEHDWRFHVPNRDPNSPDYASKFEFPGNYYPSFFLGYGTVMSRDVARDLIIASDSVPLLHCSDGIYLGLLARKCGIDLIHNKRFHLKWPILKSKRVHYTRHDVNGYLVINNVASPNQHIRMNLLAHAMMKIEHCWFTRILNPDPDS